MSYAGVENLSLNRWEAVYEPEVAILLSASVIALSLIKTLLLRAIAVFYLPVSCNPLPFGVSA